MFRFGVSTSSCPYQHTPLNKDIAVLEEAMHTDLLPIRMSSSIMTFDQTTPGWTLAEIDEQAMEQPRRFISKVNFDSPFSYTPLVHISVTGFDMDNRDSARLSVHAEAITPTGFVIALQTWQYSRVYKVEISWLALGT